MFERFYPDGDSAAAHKFADSVLERTEGRASAAQVQGYFMLHKDDPQGALAEMDSFWTK
jgi:hypothetical protein